MLSSANLRATLRFSGDALVPDQVTALLGVAPTDAHTKDDQNVRRSNGVLRLACSGSWQLAIANLPFENFDAEVAKLLKRLPQDLSVWASLTHFRPSLFCGVFMDDRNVGLTLAPDTLKALADRTIALELDIYERDPADNISPVVD